MNPSRRDALVKLESELRVNLSLDGILPLLEKTQDGRGGFMTRVERMSVEAEGGDLARASKIIGLLRKKDNRAFDRFCEILCESGNEDWGKKLRDAAEVSPRVICKSDVVGAYINEPTIPGLKDHLETVNFELMTRIFKLPDEIYQPLKLSCEDYIGSLTSIDPLSYQQPHPLQHNREEMCREIKRYWTPLDIQFLERIIRWIGDSDLLSLLEQHRTLIVQFSTSTLQQWRKEQIFISKEHLHLTAKIEGDPTIGRILEIQSYLAKLGVDNSLFEGFKEGSVVLYFLISLTSAHKMLSALPTHLSAFRSMGVITLGVVGQWEVDVVKEKAAFNMTRDSSDVSSRPLLWKVLLEQGEKHRSVQGSLVAKDESFLADRKYRDLESQLYALRQKNSDLEGKLEQAKEQGKWAGISMSVSSVVKELQDKVRMKWLMGQFTDTVHDILKDGTHEEVDMVRKLLLNQVEEMTELEREAGVCLRKLQDQRSCEVLHQADEKPWKDKTPSDCSFPFILEKVPNWPSLAIRLGVPFDKVESLQAQPDPIMGAFKALRLWQSKHQTIARGCPPTWEFLLKAVNDCASPRVSNEIAERVAVEETFSEQDW